MLVMNHMKWIPLVFLLGQPFASAASFDCTQARSTVEKTICASDELSSLDDKLGAVYAAALQDDGARDVVQLKKEQVQWLRTVRNKCPDAACLLTTYLSRLNDLDPFADRKITCDEMRQAPRQVFSDGIDLGSGHGSPTEVDYECPESLSQQDFMQTLLSLAEEIRGNEGPRICSGTIGYAQWRYYSFNLTEAGFVPPTYVQSSESLQPFKDFDSLSNASDATAALVYFKQWSERSQSNLKLYSRFATEFDQVRPQLIQHYEQKFNLRRNDAQTAAMAALMLPLGRAAGSYAYDELHTDSALTKLVRGPQVTASDLRQALDDRGDGDAISEQEIEQALLVALLNNRSLEVVSLLAESLPPEALRRVANEREPLLSFAVGSQKNLEYLLKNQVPVDAANDFGKTALFYAIGLNNRAAVQVLLGHGANVNHAYHSAKELRPDDNECSYYDLTHTRRTPLMHAAQHSDVAMLKLLIQAGALVTAADDLGFNALDYAAMGKQAQNVSYLKSVGLVPGATTDASDENP